MIELDVGIVDFVKNLQHAGFKTTGSCEGGDGHAFAVPTVQLDAQGDLPGTRQRVILWLGMRSMCATVSERYICQRNRVMPESYVEIELW